MKNLKNGIYLKNPPDSISNDLNFDVNYLCPFSNIEKWDEFCLIVKKQFTIISSNAGATHPLECWLDGLNTGGKLLLPLTVSTSKDHGFGRVIKIFKDDDGYSAEFISLISIFNCEGARNNINNKLLQDAFAGGGEENVTLLRRESHEKTDSCFLHAEGFCLSTNLYDS